MVAELSGLPFDVRAVVDTAGEGPLDELWSTLIHGAVRRVKTWRMAVENEGL
jgi:hypothetical protein